MAEEVGDVGGGNCDVVLLDGPGRSLGLLMDRGDLGQAQIDVAALDSRDGRDHAEAVSVRGVSVAVGVAGRVPERRVGVE